MWTFKIQAQFDRLNQHNVTNSEAIILKLRRRKQAPFENHDSKKAVISENSPARVCNV
jgi:hypothetical protein